ncbi:MAG: DUF72 domain-containing protein [Nitrospiraceae bacterium]|nr:MAG: DUF72 domain-containing protein [Nitrospiraceae bacterium]
MIRVGTCSWTEKTLIESGEFYPREVKSAKDRLRYYAGTFNTVEVDATYYAIPDVRIVQYWSERTPEDFTFHIKAFGALTGHGVDPRSLPKEIRQHLPEDDLNKRYIYIREPSLLQLIAQRFREVMNPLRRENKLGVLVFQFPPWFHYNHANMDYILTCKNRMANLPFAVEFRHGSWLTPDRAETVVQFLRKNRITYITADEPQYGSLATIPFLPKVTSDISYFRFHGRNKQNWLKKGVATSLRYDYLYSDNELKEFLPPLLDINRQAKTSYAMFNNCHGGFAIKNALRLRKIMEEEALT